MLFKSVFKYGVYMCIVLTCLRTNRTVFKVVILLKMRFAHKILLKISGIEESDKSSFCANILRVPVKSISK